MVARGSISSSAMTSPAASTSRPPPRRADLRDDDALAQLQRGRREIQATPQVEDWQQGAPKTQAAQQYGWRFRQGSKCRERQHFANAGDGESVAFSGKLAIENRDDALGPF